ncbi:Hypothetical conserved protein OS=uncultured planctomycete GN=HGMM_F09D09C09 PE=4 SV=1 [Gemmataceae bacterium]|nr:Hypothetical conserved protein OS=uncultured planctomycete GN=HGMM_F09D09C09 PE=4 SV=1 [Gemmataceae bacterium]VTU02101.1 Hypothetical conserved protein OS=uncultured planctomycete GN=HGMM_F09D09C09 PE=4 SV=1 [Gemmataceae bacterium]
MRRKLVFGLGLAGVLTGAGASVAQFAADRTPTPPTLPVSPVPVQSRPAALPTPGARPALPAPPGGVGAVPTNPIQQAGGTVEAPSTPPPADVEIRSALGANHPWAIKPEHGAYFILVKSYSRPNRPTPQDNGPSARTLAEELASEIRNTFKVQALLYEYVSPERRAEMASIAAARERARVFAAQINKYKEQAALQGMEFLEPDNRVHFKTVNYQDQIAVLVGGFKTDVDARKALDTLRKWPAPKNKNLMDGAVVQRANKDGKVLLEEGHLNPYLTAHVVPNPTVARADAAPSEPIDPFIVKLNEGRPYSLLKAKKAWTLGVKSFTAPVEIVSKDAGTGLMRAVGSAGKGADVLKAGAEQAEKLAEALRNMRGKGAPADGFEAFVLHTRTASVVTVGQFDGPDDPALLQTKQLLASIKLNLSKDREGYQPVTNAPSLFDNMMPVPVPH